MQFIVILFASYAASKFRSKSLILLILTVPVIAGLAMLYTIKHTDSNQGALLAGYYLLSFLFGGNPLIVAWIVGNTAGTTKKSALMSIYNAGSSAGNIIGQVCSISTSACELPLTSHVDHCCSTPKMHRSISLVFGQYSVSSLRWPLAWFCKQRI